MHPRPQAAFCFQADAREKDYHKNMDSTMFMWWVENRLTPAFEKVHPCGQVLHGLCSNGNSSAFWAHMWCVVSRRYKCMILVLDNAPYHWSYGEDCVNLRGAPVKNRGPKTKVKYTLVEMAGTFKIKEVLVDRGGNEVKVKGGKFGMPPLLGGATVAELKPAVKAWFQKHKPEVNLRGKWANI